MKNIYNFSAGPAQLPKEVMEQAQQEFLDWHGTGMSIMEMSHRGTHFNEIREQSTADLRALLAIPENYHILFLHGGSQSQFSMVPMNLLGEAASVAYLQTGLWSQLAVEEARRFADVALIADGAPSNYATIPSVPCWAALDPKAAYLFYTDNETVHGNEFSFVPGSGDIPLVCDMSSNILSRPIDVSRYGIIFACAQKNLGPAGVTVVIIRDDLLQRKPLATTPKMFRYQLHAEKQSMLNTSPTYPWYMVGLVLQWIKRQGGVEKMDECSIAKSQKLYQYIDQTDFYSNSVDPSVRSRINVVFNIQDPALESDFIEQALTKGLANLKGHRTVGGLRASLYTGMPEAGVDALILFMKDFERKYG